MVYRNVRVRDILDDESFRYSSKRNSSLLVNSIKRWGILSPLMLVRVKRDYKLVAGFRRYEAARSLGLERVPAGIHRASVPFEKLVLKSVEEQRTIRDLTLVEKARVLRLVKDDRDHWKTVPPDLFDLLSLPPRSPVLQSVVGLLDLEPSVQKYIEQYDLSLKQTDRFRGLSKETQNSLIQMARILGLRSVELGGLLDWIRDIAVREGIEVGSVLERDQVQSIVNDSGRTRIERLSRLKELLQQERYPLLNRWNEELERMCRQMSLPEEIRISWDRTFERPGIRIGLQPRSIAQFEDQIVGLTGVENRRYIEAMLGIAGI